MERGINDKKIGPSDGAAPSIKPLERAVRLPPPSRGQQAEAAQLHVMC